MIKHKHHIIPKHMGGTDDESNLVLLTVEEHAVAHYELFREHGHWEDYVAWIGLKGLIPKAELTRLIQSCASKERLRIKGNPFCGTQTSSNFLLNEENRRYAASKAHSPEASIKRKRTFLENEHQKGNKNSQCGTKWCVRKEAKDLSERKRFVVIPDGWITTTEWKQSKKDKLNSAFGKHWYNDGKKNYLLSPDDELTNSLSIGRIMVVNCSNEH